MEKNSVDTRQFNAMCDQLARLVPSKPVEEVVLSEVGRALEKAAQYTRSARISKIRARYMDFVPMSLESYSPRRVRRYGGNLRGNYLVYYMQNRYSNELWARLNARRGMLIARTIAARGLAKKSWLQLAAALGVKINVPGYVASAIATTGKDYNDVSATTSRSDNNILIRIENAQPTVIAIGGAAAFARALQGRVKYFQKSAEKAVFADVAKIAKSYPGMKMKLAA